MTVTARGVGLLGIDGVIVDVQVAHQDGLPGIDITGLPSASIREARHRVRSALRAAGYGWPTHRLVANFAPADFPKVGTAFDLPLAVAILALDGRVPRSQLSSAVFFGELALDGGLLGVPGAVNAALAARDAGAERLVVAEPVAGEAAAVPGLAVQAAPDLVTLVRAMHGELDLPLATPRRRPAGTRTRADLALVRGQARARRALEVAAAGGHNILLVGPPGCGKTLSEDP